MLIPLPCLPGQISYMNHLEAVFGELGISQYLNAFVNQGFDSWDTILDVTESDLDALGVKLGHRRKLQRRIANFRGVAPDASLVSPARTSIEDARQDASRIDAAKTDTKTEPVAMKRKYRRHPKPDEHAPERPPSAYVLFSNKMREDLKGQNLTFTEIAKLVGENWQNLGRVEKEPFERQANEAKEKYNRDLAGYKKTAECRKYSDYLREFRKRQAAQTQEKDVTKRLKTDTDSIRGSSTSGASIGTGGATNGTRSSSESQQGSEPPPSRQQRLDSMASSSAVTNHGDESLTSPIMLAQEDSNLRRQRGPSNSHSRGPSIHSTGHRPSWADGPYLPGDGVNSGMPWLDSRAAPTNVTQSPDIMGVQSGQGLYTDSSMRGATSPRTASISQPPLLRHDSSMHGSISSSSSHSVRTPSDASLPIHALLSSKPEPPVSYVSTPSPLIANGSLSHAQPSAHPPQYGRMPSGYYGSSYFSSGATGSRSSHTGPSVGLAHEAASSPAHDQDMSVTTRPINSENGLDGIAALLKAREIVDRRS